MAQKNFGAMAQTHIWHADFNLAALAYKLLFREGFKKKKKKKSGIFQI